MATVVRAGYLEEVGWPKLGEEQPAWRAPQPRRPAPSPDPGSSARRSRDAARPLQAAARRLLSPERRVRHWSRRRLRGGSPSLYLSASLAFPAAFSRHQVHDSLVFPSGRAQPSCLLVACSRLRGRRGHLPLLLPPLPIRRKNYCRQHAESAHYNVSLEKSGPKRTRLAVSREPRGHFTSKHKFCAQLSSRSIPSTNS